MCATDTPLGIALKTLGYIPCLLNALNGLVYFLIIGDPRGNNLMVGSISRKWLTELGIQTEDAECKHVQNFELTPPVDERYLCIDMRFFRYSCVPHPEGIL